MSSKTSSYPDEIMNKVHYENKKVATAKFILTSLIKNLFQNKTFWNLTS